MHSRSFLLIVFVLILGGCEHSALMKMRREARETEQRILIKEQRLEDLQNQNKILMEEKKRLLLELETKQMTLNQLSERLDKLQKENASMRSGNDRQQKEKESLEMQIQNYQDEIDALRSTDELTIEEKRKKIKQLTEKIKAYLEMGLK